MATPDFRLTVPVFARFRSRLAGLLESAAVVSLAVELGRSAAQNRHDSRCEASSVLGPRLDGGQLDLFVTSNLEGLGQAATQLKLECPLHDWGKRQGCRDPAR